MTDKVEGGQVNARVKLERLGVESRQDATQQNTEVLGRREKW